MTRIGAPEEHEAVADPAPMAVEAEPGLAAEPRPRGRRRIALVFWSGISTPPAFCGATLSGA
jgi:hypothetical protein